jgi:flagellar biosynthesis protein FlhB
MWSDGAREAYRLFVALVGSKLTRVFEAVEEYITEYHYYILIGSTILAIVVILDLFLKRRENRKKVQIDQKIAEQMKEKGVKSREDNLGIDQ